MIVGRQNPHDRSFPSGIAPTAAHGTQSRDADHAQLLKTLCLSKEFST
jgi:hypothetical protein